MDIKRIRSVLAAASASLLIVVGTTMAFFTSTDEVSNRFEGGKLRIRLIEDKWKPESGTNVVPGEELDKNPVVKNEEESPCYVFLRVTVPCGVPEIEYDHSDGNHTKGEKLYEDDSEMFPMYKFITNGSCAALDTGENKYSQTVHDSWRLLGGYPIADPGSKKVTYVYAYMGANNGDMAVLYTDELTAEPLFDGLRVVNFDENRDSSANASVVVEALAIQSEHLAGKVTEPSAVWALLNSEG